MVSSALFLVHPFLLAAALSGCVGNAPPYPTEVAEELHHATPLNEPALLEHPPVALEQVPVEPAPEVIARAKAASAPGPDTKTFTLSLAEARRDALANNLDLHAEVYNSPIAEQGYRAELAKFEAVLGAAFNYNETKSPTPDANGNSSTTVRTRSFEPSVRVPLQTGGTASLSLPFVRHDDPTFDLFGMPIGHGGVNTTTFSFSQPLLRGAGTTVNRASINVAGLQVQQTDARTRLFAIRLLANTERAYWQYYAAYENLRLQVQLYDLAQEQLRMAQRLVEEGVRTKVEVTRAQSGVARRFDAIIVAETTRRNAERELKRIINVSGLAVDSATVVRLETSPRLEGLTFDRGQVAAFALKNRMELLDNEVQQAIDRITVDVDRNATLPDLRFEYRYSHSNAKPKFDQTLDQIASTAVSLVAELPLEGNRAARARLHVSLLHQAQTRASRESLEISVRQEVSNAVDALEQNWQRILSNRIAVAAAQETYDAERTQFQVGFSTTTDVLIALSNLAEAQAAQIQTIADYQSALVDLAFATGTVLGAGGVVWTAAPEPKR
jgi:outer membrane protein TolC